MDYSIRLLERDLTRLKWLKANEDGDDTVYTDHLTTDILDLETSIKALKQHQSIAANCSKVQQTINTTL